METHALSELEGCTLGLIWEMGPCTIYSVRKVLEGSPNPYWSGSAGAVYPLVRRLAEQGLVTSQEAFRGKRRHVNYSITESGLVELRAWIGPPVADYVVAIPADPMRTRVRFFGALDPTTRSELLEVAREQCEREIEIAIQKQDEAKLGQDPFEPLIPLGVGLMARARLTWINEVRRLLDDTD